MDIIMVIPGIGSLIKNDSFLDFFGTRWLLLLLLLLQQNNRYCDNNNC
jgi:hypothetical protein